MGRFRACSKKKRYAARMDIERAQESLKAAQLCLQKGLANSAASRAYYAMFQAAQVAMSVVGSPQSEWSHHGLQADFVTELIRRRKMYSAVFRDYLSPTWRATGGRLWTCGCQQENCSTLSVQSSVVRCCR